MRTEFSIKKSTFFLSFEVFLKSSNSTGSDAKQTPLDFVTFKGIPTVKEFMFPF